MANKLFPANPVVLIDDDQHTLDMERIVLKSGGINHCILCNDPLKAMSLIKEHNAEVVILDLVMPEIDGTKLLEIMMEESPQIPVIITTGTDEVEIAVECMSKGAFDYMLKPTPKERLIASVRRAIELRQLRSENELLKERFFSDELDSPEIFACFDSSNSRMISIFKYAESIAKSPEPMLITGETGTGKDLMAKCIFKLSECSGPFVPVNVAGLDENTFSDTLFGHTKGAFTGAETSRKGIIEQATDGILFLDEIGDLNPASQVKLLRLLQEREYTPIGSDTPKKTNARFVVATNKMFSELKNSESFRKDLFYRLCHHHIHLPPLRDRMSDLPLLISTLSEKASKKMNKATMIIPDGMIELLHSYQFPGNIRELEGMINNAVSSSKGRSLSLSTIRRRIGKIPHEPADPSVQSPASPENDTSISFGSRLPTLQEAQNALIKEALRRSCGKISKAAQLLGVTRQALSKRLATRKG